MNKTLENRYEIKFFIQAQNCNYNGDPDFDNLPRIDYETNRGYMTDVSIKRKIRDYVQEAYDGEVGKEIFVRSAENLNKRIAECMIAANKEGKVTEGKNSALAGQIACERFWDVRTFGGVLTTGLNAGQIIGAVQFEMPFSLDVVDPQYITIDRVSYAEGKSANLEDYEKIDEKTPSDKKRTMGKKTFVPYALFECHAFISANLAKKIGFSEEDLNTLLEAILNMYNIQATSSKAGMSVVGPVIVFKHVGSKTSSEKQLERERLLGCCAPQKLFKTVSVVKKEDVEYPRDYTDYEATIDFSKIPETVEVGFKYEPFGDIIWNQLGEDDEWFKKL